MEQQKSLYDFLNEATALSPEREEEIKQNAIKYANEFLKEITTEKKDS